MYASYFLILIFDDFKEMITMTNDLIYFWIKMTLGKVCPWKVIVWWPVIEYIPETEMMMKKVFLLSEMG